MAKRFALSPQSDDDLVISIQSNPQSEQDHAKASLRKRREHDAALQASVHRVDQPMFPMTRWQATCRRGLLATLEHLCRGSLTIVEQVNNSNCQQSTLTLGQPDQPGEIHASIIVSTPAFFTKVATGGSLAASESFLAGEWTSPDPVAVLRLLARNREVLLSVDDRVGWLKNLAAKAVHRLNRNSKTGSRKNIAAHYDLGNEFFELFLDPTMTYSSGIFESPTSTLQEASLAKYDRVCRQLNLKPTDHVVEIGTGWGGFALYAAENYGCRITTTTISRRQHDLARERIDASKYRDQITLRNDDYRDLNGQFDKLVSIEMIEAVGHDYHATFFRKCSDLLKPDGQMLLQVITIPDQRYETYRKTVDFIQKYIFPGGCLLSVARVLNVISEVSEFEIGSLFEFGEDYARTLRCWHDALVEHEDEIRQMGKDEQFLRAWHYYFAYCEAAFLEKQIGVSQILLNMPDFRKSS